MTKKKCKYSGKSLTGKEISVVAALYTSEPSKAGILRKVKRDFLEIAKNRKGFRKDIATQTIAKVRDEHKLEEFRLKNVEKIRQKYQANGENILDNNIQLLRRLKAVVVARLLKTRKPVMPSFGDIDKLIRLECFLKGGADSRSETIGLLRDYDNVDDSEIKKELKRISPLLVG